MPRPVRTTKSRPTTAPTANLAARAPIDTMAVLEDMERQMLKAVSQITTMIVRRKLNKREIEAARGALANASKLLEDLVNG